MPTKVIWDSKEMAYLVDADLSAGGDGLTISQVAAAIGEHNTDPLAHAAIRLAITQETIARGAAITAHNTDTSAHADIRALLNSLLDGLPTYNASTHVITFTRHDGATLTIDLPLEGLQQGWDFDAVAQEFVITKLDGTEIRIDASDFVKAYTGSTGSNIQISIAPNGTISAALLDGTVDMAKLTSALQTLINGKLDATAQAADSAQLGGQAAGLFLRRDGGDNAGLYTVRNFSDEATAIAYSTANPGTIVFAATGA